MYPYVFPEQVENKHFCIIGRPRRSWSFVPNGTSQKLLKTTMNCLDHYNGVILHFVLQTFSILAIRQYLL